MAVFDTNELITPFVLGEQEGWFEEEWAIETANTTAAYLARGIELEAPSNVTLLRSPLSQRVGTANLFLSDNSELNSVVAGGTAF